MPTTAADTNPVIKNIGDIKIDLLWWFVDVAVAVLVGEHKGERGGGTFNLRSPDGTVLFDHSFRNPDAVKAERYNYIAREKTERLARHADHILSWQSMDVALERYQGGVRAPNSLLGAFSGFTAEEDEALVLWVFNQMGWMSAREADVAAMLSANSRYNSLCLKFGAAMESAD